MPKILVLEDSPMDQRVLQGALGRLYELKFSEDAKNFVRQALEFGPDLILLDIVLPRVNGFEVYSELRKDPRLAEIPVFFVSGKTAPMDRVTGLSLGADDYVTKPFNVEELKLRVANRLRLRQSQKKDASNLVECGKLRIDTVAQSVHIVEEEQSTLLVLTPTEYRLLLYLARHENEVVSRKDVLQSVWANQNVHVTERSVDTQIKALRQKLTGCEHYIVTVYGEGYRLNSSEAPMKFRRAG